MRTALIAMLAALASGCGPEAPKDGSVAQAIETAANPGALWPVLLAHCLRAPGCDPMTDFGQGAGQASGLVEQVSYFVDSAGAGGAGEKSGAAITLSLFATRARGGEAGRPLTIDETASDLRVAKARRSTLSIGYRMTGAGLTPYSIAFTSAQIALATPGEFETREAMTRAAAAHVGAMRWPDGGAGARIEIATKTGVLFSGYSTGAAASDRMDARAALRRGFEPWVFDVVRDLDDDPLPELMAAIESGETLGLKIAAPDGSVMLQDAFYTEGYGQALREASEALADPELARTLPERCARFAGEPDAFWKIADVTAALRVCDPRTVDQRRRASESAPPAPDQ